MVQKKANDIKRNQKFKVLRTKKFNESNIEEDG